MISVTTFLTVAAGGAIGASLRFSATLWATRAFGPGFPYGTLGVNVVGSLIMGIAAALLFERSPDSWSRLAPFLMSGVLGGFTTFSAYSLDALGMIERGATAQALIFIVGSVVLSIGAAWAGLAVVRAF